MDVYTELTRLMQENPALVFNNDGYEYLSKEIRESHKEAIAEIETILKTVFPKLTRFDNFKPRKNATRTAVRFQSIWTEEPYFIGVNYVALEDLKSEEPECL